MRTVRMAAIGVATFLAGSGLQAQTLSGNLTVDDAFFAYISTNDSVAGTLVDSSGSSYWYTTQSFSASLTPGTTYYLHIYGKDIFGDVSGFVGSFSLAGTGFTFANGAQTLLTNSTNWNVSTTGFGTGYFTPVNYGAGALPWGVRQGIDPNADWIWTGPKGTLGQAYFSTVIEAAAVPEPSTLALVLPALGLMGLIARRRQQR